MTEQPHSLATRLRSLSPATALKITICLLAVLAIGYTQTLVESWGGGYGGWLRQPLITQIEDRFNDIWSDFGGFDLSTTMSDPYPHYPWDAAQGELMVLILALLIGLYLWHTLWAAPRRRERLLAEELQPMSRLVHQHPARKAAHSKPHKRHPSGAPAWH